MPPRRPSRSITRVLLTSLQRAVRSGVLFLSMVMWAIARAFGTPKIEDPPPKNPVVQREEEG